MTGQFTLSFFIREIALALAAPFNSSETTLGTLLGLAAGKISTLNLASEDT